VSEGNVTEEKVAISDTAVVEAPVDAKPPRAPGKTATIISSVGLVITAIAYLWELNRLTASNPDQWMLTVGVVSLIGTVVALWAIVWKFNVSKVAGWVLALVLGATQIAMPMGAHQKFSVGYLKAKDGMTPTEVSNLIGKDATRSSPIPKDHGTYSCTIVHGDKIDIAFFTFVKGKMVSKRFEPG
jgi:hypothetical protein